MWHLRAKHCPLCGTDLVENLVEGRPRLSCRSCAFVLYSNPASAAAGVVLNPSGEVLLVRRRIEPFRGWWALPAGYQEVDEELPATVAREVLEESGLEIRVHGLLDLIFVPDDPRKPANVAVYLCSSGGGGLRAGDDVQEAAWFHLDRLPERIGFDNYERILSRLRDRDRYPGSVWDALGGMLGDPRADR